MRFSGLGCEFGGALQPDVTVKTCTIAHSAIQGHKAVDDRPNVVSQRQLFACMKEHLCERTLADSLDIAQYIRGMVTVVL